MNDKIIKTAITLILLLLNSIIYAQNKKKIDSIFSVLKTTKCDTTKVNSYINLCAIYCSVNPDTALIYGALGLKLAVKIKYKKGIASCCFYNGIANKNIGNYKNAIELLTNSIKNYEELITIKAHNEQKEIIEWKKGISYCYMYIGDAYLRQGNYYNAIEYNFKALKIYEEIIPFSEVDGKNGISDCFINIGIVYSWQGSYDKAIEYNFKALKINEELGDKKGISYCYNHIGIVYINQGKYNNAIKYLLNAIKYLKELGNQSELPSCYSSVGMALAMQKSYDKALEYFFNSLKIHKELGNKKDISNCLIDIGMVYKSQGVYNKAIEYFLECLKIRENLGDKNGIALVCANLARLHIIYSDSVALTQTEKNKHYNEAIRYGLKSLTFSKEIKSISCEINALNKLMIAYKNIGNYKKYAEYAELYIIVEDSMSNDEKTKALAGMESKYQNEKKQLEIDKLGKEKELQLSENKKQRIFIWFVVSCFSLLVVIAILIFRSLHFTRKQKNVIEKQKIIVDEKNALLNQQNEEIRAQRDEIEAQKDEISEQRDTVTNQKEQIEHIYSEVTNSIRYAERIQNAVLPQKKIIETSFSEYFILFRPRDIVSGDFYWFTKRDNWLLIAVADCTGHGVPGAFISMLGISFLNEIVSKDEITESSQVLNELRNYVIKSLQQKGIEGEQKDGMDISFLAINQVENILQYSGANNPLYLIQNNKKSELIEIKADKMPIGIYEEMHSFKTHEIKINKDDSFYIFTDGFIDQFGGEKRKKFMSKNLRESLLNIVELPMIEQRNTLIKIFENWKGNHEQIDDVTVLGIKI